jgi:hypothetical protein
MFPVRTAEEVKPAIARLVTVAAHGGRANRESDGQGYARDRFSSSIVSSIVMTT